MRSGEGQNREIDSHEREALERVLRATGDLRSILDVGTGNGRWTPVLTSKKPRLLATLDLSNDALLAARHANNGTTERSVAVCGDAGALPFAAQSFDLILCLGLMPYVRRSGRLRALKEMRRVSSRWVVVQYAHTQGWAYHWQRVRGLVGLEVRFPRNHLSDPEIEAELRRAGLGVRGVARIGGAFSQSCFVLAEAPSSGWMKE